jgi:hypothetical protein
MKIFLAVLAGLFILSRLQQGQGVTGSVGAGGEIPYGGAAGIIENFLNPVFSAGGGGGLIGGIHSGVSAGATFSGFNSPKSGTLIPKPSYRAATGITY